MTDVDDLRSVIRGLSPTEVFDYYDGPRFYSCRDAAGQLYIVYWVDEADVGSIWLYVRVSAERYAALKRGDVSVAVALSQPEDKKALLVTTASSDFWVHTLAVNEIAPEWLPSADYRLSLAAHDLPARQTEPADLAPRVHRQVLDVAFGRATNSYEMAAGKLGRLLSAIQNVVYALSCDPGVDVRRVPEDTKQRSELLVTGLFASSFGVRLQSKASDLFANDDASRALKTLNALVDGLNRPEQLTEQLHSLNILARSRFKHLVRLLVETQVDVRTQWGDPQGQSADARATFSDIALSLKKLESADAGTTQVVERNARLVGVDVQSDFFAIVLDDGEVIKGELAKGLQAKQFEVPSMVIATLEETSTVDPLTDKEKWSYVLLDVNPARQR